MSATEVIERFGLTDTTAEHVERLVCDAIKYNHWAANFRRQFPVPEGGWVHSFELTGEMHFRAYRGQARTAGWVISKIIDRIVREEEALAARDVENWQARFWMGSCGDETCADCDRPLWHHIEHDSLGRLCPLGRRYWQLARALTRYDREGGPVCYAPALRIIAATR